MSRFSIATVMSAALLLGAGCASEPEPEPYEARLATPVATLEIDPTDEIDVVGWWSNGVDLLRLDLNATVRAFRARAEIGTFPLDLTTAGDLRATGTLDELRAATGEHYLEDIFRQVVQEPGA